MEVQINLEPLDKNGYETDTWLNEELSGCSFADKRLGKRFRGLCERLWPLKKAYDMRNVNAF